jgi:hypothetical protein
MLEKQVAVDKIEVAEDGRVQVRQATRIIENGVEISKTFHRSVLVPGQNVADQESRVRAVCNAVWTPEVVTAYQAVINAVQRTTT